MGLMGMMLVAACDKIPPEEYTIAAGGSGQQWAEGAVAYVEKYTGPRCTNCPEADRTLEAAHHIYGDRLVVVSVNTMSDAFGAPMTGNPDMRTEDGAVWEQHWGISSFPTAYVGRSGSQYTGDMRNITGGIEAVLTVAPSFSVSVSAAATGSSLAIDTEVKTLADYDGAVTLTLVLTEDSLAYWQLDGSTPNPNYVHNHMLRDVVTEPWGKSFAPAAAGASATDHTDYTVTNGDIVVENCNIVALVCDAASHKVLGCGQCRVSDE